MKKTLTVNLNGRVFNIDEDAYNLLDKYLRNLRDYFRKEEGASEILTDFEGRIEELFSEHIRKGAQVITIENVETVIKQMGQPEDFGDKQPEDQSQGKEKSYQDKTKQTWEERKTARKRFYRDLDDKMFGGVCSGIAAYFGWEVLPVRIITLILIFFTSLGLLPLYIILWIFVPVAKTAEQKLEMRGEAVTLENIGKTVAAETTEIVNHSRGCLGSLLDFIVALLKVCLIGFGLLIGLPLVFALIIMLIVVFAVIFGVGGGLVALPLSVLGMDIDTISAGHPTLAVIAFTILLAIPLISLIYWLIAHFAKLNPLPKSVKWTSTLVWILALICLIYSMANMKIDMGKIHFHHGKWSNWHDKNRIEGNGILADRQDTVPAFDIVSVDDEVIGSVELEQSVGDTTAWVKISGDSNLIDKITCDVTNGKLVLSVKDNYYLDTKEHLKIKVFTPRISGVEFHSVGNITIPRKLKTDTFYITLDGAGTFQADSVYCNDFKAHLDGVGTLTAAGRANTSSLSLQGAGKIKASDFEADEVHAELDGVGSINCNPVKKLVASVNGVGSIHYKNEPQIKEVQHNGIGTISRN